MNIEKIEITPHEKYKGWFRIVLTSHSSNLGKTTVEFFCSGEMLRWIRNECNITLDESFRTSEEESDENVLNGKLKDFGK